MKSRFLVLTGLMFTLMACNMLGGSSKIASPTETTIPETKQIEKTRSSSDLQEDLIAEWRPVHDRAAVMLDICFMVSETRDAFNQGEISLERALLEQDAESRFIQTIIEKTSLVESSNEVVASYLKSLDEPTSVLIEVLEAGEKDKYGGVSVYNACESLQNINENIAADAQAAGMSLENLTQLGLDIYPVIEDVMALESNRSVADRPTSTPDLILEATTSAGQGELKAEWRPAYIQGALLFETCTMIYQTHADFDQGGINFERARDELEVEAEFVEYVLRSITSDVPRNEKVASHVLGIEAQASSLTKWLKPKENDIGTSTVLSAIDDVCSSLQERMNIILADAKTEGMSADSFGELDAEISPMVNDLYDRTWYGR